MQRTPPPKSTCTYCKKDGTDEMAQCSGCNLWVHKDCAGEDSLTKRRFQCVKCVSQKQAKKSTGAISKGQSKVSKASSCAHVDQLRPNEDKGSRSEKRNSSCLKCDGLDNEEMVQCDICDMWIHYECAGVDSSIQYKQFQCDACAIKTMKETADSIISKGHVDLRALKPRHVPTCSCKSWKTNKNCSRNI